MHRAASLSCPLSGAGEPHLCWPVRGFPLAPYLVSFPCFLLVSLQHPLVSSGNPGETPWNSSFWGGSEPCLRLFWGQNRQNTGYFAGIPGKPRYTWKIPGYRADFLNFAPDFAPDQLSDSGKLASFPRETREKQNGAPNTLWFPWKLPETQSAGDPLVSLWVAGNPWTGQPFPQHDWFKFQLLSTPRRLTTSRLAFSEVLRRES